MKLLFDAPSIYEWTDDDIVRELCSRIRQVRRSCNLTQDEFAKETGVSIATLKRIETKNVRDLSLRTIIKIERSTGVLDGVVDLVPSLPDSPFRKTSKKR